MTYQELKQHIKAIESYIKFYSGVLASYPKSSMGMVAQENRDDKYRNARTEYRKWFQKLQAANTHKVKFFKSEYQAERKNRVGA